MAQADLPLDPDRPRLIAADHVSFTVTDAEATAAFYKEAFGAEELYRMGPIDAGDMPPMPDGRDWMAGHLGIPGARITLIRLSLAENLELQLAQYDGPEGRATRHPRSCDIGGFHLALRVDDVEKARRFLLARGCTAMEIIALSEGPLAGKKNLYLRDPFGNPLEIVD